MGRVSVHSCGAESSTTKMPESVKKHWLIVMLCQVWSVQVKQDLASDSKGCLVLRGASHTQGTSPDNVHPLSTDAWAEGEGFPGEARKVGGKDGLEPWWRVAGERERTVGFGDDGGRQETT